MHKVHILLFSFVFVLVLIKYGTNAQGFRHMQRGDKTRLYTNSRWKFGDIRLQMLERNWFVFSLKACSDGHILLSRTPDNFEENHSFEIDIAGWGNTQSVIRYTPRNKTFAAIAQTPNLLHCSEFRSFWIFWGNNIIEIGRGNMPGEQILMIVPQTHIYSFEINYVFLSTGFGYTGVWEIPENVAHNLFVNTPDSTPLEYQFVTKSVEHRFGFFTFDVKAGSDVHIAMGPQIGEWTYQPVFGAYENSQSCIWFQGDITCVDSAGIVSDEEFRQFWIGWSNKIVYMGRGSTYMENLLLQFEDPAFQSIGYMSFSTGYGYNGEWKFNENLENEYLLMRNPNSGDRAIYNNWVFTAHQHYIIFHAQACSDVWLVLSNRMHNDGDDNTYHVFIGRNENSKTGITSTYDGSPLKEEDTPGILQCRYPITIWLSWMSQTVALGVGSVQNESIYFTYPLPEPFEVQSVGFSNPTDFDSYFRVRKNIGDLMYMKSAYDYGYNNAWMSTKEDNHVYVRIRACKEAHLLLTQHERVIGNNAMEIIIGLDGSKTAIKERVGDQDYVVENDTPDVLSCNEYRLFWISWVDRWLWLGRGFRYGRHVLAAHSERVSFPINSISVSTKQGTGEFEFESNRGDFHTIRTPTDSLDYKWMHVIAARHWFYFGLAARSSTIMITRDYLKQSSSYTFHLGAERGTQFRLYKGSKLLESTTYPDLMDRDEMKDFWISWADGQIELGQGRYRGHRHLINYKDGSPIKDIRGVAVAGLEGEVGYWRFFDRQGIIESSFDTSQFLNYDQFWISTYYRPLLFFGIRGVCNNVFIMLSTVMHSTGRDHTYIIQIQDNDNMTSIWAPYASWSGSGHKKYVTRRTPNALSCSGEEHHFWLHWLDGHIALGRGLFVGHGIVISHMVMDPLIIRAISVSTNSTVGVFRFPASGLSFVDLPDRNDGLSGGEIAGAVFGFLALFGLFGGAIFVILRPPPILQPYILPPGEGGKEITIPSVSLSRSAEPPNPEDMAFENPNVEGGAGAGATTVDIDIH